MTWIFYTVTKNMKLFYNALFLVACELFMSALCLVRKYLVATCTTFLIVFIQTISILHSGCAYRNNMLTGIVPYMHVPHPALHAFAPSCPTCICLTCPTCMCPSCPTTTRYLWAELQPTENFHKATNELLISWFEINMLHLHMAHTRKGVKSG